MRLTPWAALLIVFPCAPVARAHPGPHEEIDRLSALIDAEPRRADLYIERAYQMRLAGADDGALKDLDQAQKLAPDNIQIAFHRGITLAEMNQPQAAEAELTRFLGQVPDSPVAFAERGRIRERAGRTGEALADYSAAIALRPDVELYLLRGALEESLGRLDEAAAGYRDGLTKLGDAVTLRQALVRVELSRKEYDAALALIDEAMTKASVRTSWRLLRAEVLDAAKRAEEARSERLAALAEIDAALARRPSAIHLVTRAEICLALGKTDDARRDVDLALAKAPHYHEALELREKLNAQADKN